MNTFDHIHIIINPASGQDEPILNIMNRVFEAHHANWSVSITHNFGDGKRLAQQAIENGADLIVAYGGDGTIIDVVNGVVDSPVPLAVLPGGTGNGVVKEFGIPTNLKEATEAIFTHAIESVDVGFAQDTYYLLRLDIGIIADVVNDTTPQLKNHWGAMAYLMNTAIHVVRPKQTYNIQLDDQEIEIDGIGCVITNGNKIGALHFGFSEDVKIDDGLLDIIVITDVSKVLQNAASTLIKLDDNVSVNLHHWQSRTAKVTANEPMNILADGEPTGTTPLYTEIKHLALRVIKSSSKL